MKRLMMIVCAFALFLSCKKEDEEKAIVYPDYGNLKVGNYWIYQHFRIDTTGEATALDIFDTCFIERDTIIRGNTFYKMLRPAHTIYEYFYHYWRDSLGYIVDSTGKIRFSSEDFTTTLNFEVQYGGPNNDTIFTATSKMVEKDRLISTPAGEFITRTFQTRYDLEEWLSPYSPRFANLRFAKDVGIVSETLTIYSMDPNYTERRLVKWGHN